MTRDPSPSDPIPPDPTPDSPHRAPLTDALRHGAADQATGRIVVDRPGQAESAAVWLRRGVIVSAAAPGARARLGDRLVTAHLISEEQLTAALEHQRDDPGAPRLGQVLLQLEMIDAATLREVVLEQTVDSIAVAIGWPDSTWRMVPDEACDEDVTLNASVENALMEASRRLDEWHAIVAALGSLAARVDVAPSQAANLELTADEWTMLTHIDGRHSVGELAAETGVSDFHAARIVYGLLATGVVRLLDEAGGAAVGGGSTAGEGTATHRSAGDEQGNRAPSDVSMRRALSRLFGPLADDDPDG